MFPFDVILFDVGGVVLTNGWDGCERARVAERFQLDLEAFEAHHAAPCDAWERGAIDATAYLDAAVFYEPRPFSRDYFFAALLAESRLLDDGALGVVKEVTAQNRYLVGTLNNEAREPNLYRFEKFHLTGYFDVAFSSCYLGMRKPEPAIYRRVLDMLGKPAGRILFIDDRAENVAGAEAAGIRSVQFSGEAALRSALKDFGVL